MIEEEDFVRVDESDVLSESELRTTTDWVGRLVMAHCNNERAVICAWTQIVGTSIDRVGSLRLECKQWDRFRLPQGSAGRHEREEQQLRAAREATLCPGEQWTIRIVYSSSRPDRYRLSAKNKRLERGHLFVTRAAFPMDPRPVLLAPCQIGRLPHMTLLNYGMQYNPWVKTDSVEGGTPFFTFFNTDHYPYYTVHTAYIMPRMDEYVLK